MPLSYTRNDGIGRRIVPAPLVTINKNYLRNQSGGKTGSTNYTMSLQGTILPFKGSPSGNYPSLDQAFWTLGGDPPDEPFQGGNEDFNHILRKQEALRWLFSEDGGSLEWQPSGGQPVVKSNPRVTSIAFDQGVWADRCDYNIDFEADWIYINGTLDVEDPNAFDLLARFSDSWNFEEVPGRDGTQNNVTHEVNAQGIQGFDENGDPFGGKDAWEHAKDYVDTVATGTIDSAALFAALGTSGTNAGNFVRIVRLDKANGTYGVTERWLASDNSTRTDSEFTVSINNNENSFSVTYRGTIYGVANNANQGDPANLDAAKNAIPSDSEARTITTQVVGDLLNGQVLPNLPDSKNIALNQTNGTVQFTFVWDTSDDPNNLNVTQTLTSQLNFDRDTNLYTITLNQEVQGKATNADQKLINAKGAVFTNAEAREQALDLFFDTPSIVPDATRSDFATDHKSRIQAINEDQGSVRSSWTWDTRSNNGEEVSISIQNPADVIASIPIPGRIIGPIIQDMNTKTSEIVTVTIVTKGNTSKPNLNTGAYVSGFEFVISDNENFSPTTGIAQRTTRFLRNT